MINFSTTLRKSIPFVLFLAEQNEVDKNSSFEKKDGSINCQVNKMKHCLLNWFRDVNLCWDIDIAKWHLVIPKESMIKKRSPRLTCQARTLMGNSCLDRVYMDPKHKWIEFHVRPTISLHYGYVSCSRSR